MTVKARVISAFAAGRGDDATALVFEYMAATPAGSASCPPCSTASAATCQPFTARWGAVLIAGHGRQPALCWPGYASRRLSTQNVTPSRTAASTTKMPVSMPWKAQNLLAG